MPGVVSFFVWLVASCRKKAGRQGKADSSQWGPYRDAIFPGLWMNEGGQSSTGQVSHCFLPIQLGGWRILLVGLTAQLIDFMMFTHPAYPKLLELSKSTGKNIYDLLGERLDTMMKEKGAETLSANCF